jgi:glycerophosphoryl diester phosphodiesterase
MIQKESNNMLIPQGYLGKEKLLTREIISRPLIPKEILENLPKWNIPHLVAHRIAGNFVPGQIRLAPENTIPSLFILPGLGWGGFETDATANVLCPDVRTQHESPTVFVIHSDEPLERTTNGKGFPFDRSWDYIGSLDAGIRHSWEFEGVRIPKIADVIKTAKLLGLTQLTEMKVPYLTEMKGVYIEIDHKVSRQIGALIANTMKDLYSPDELPPLLSFSDNALQAAHEVEPRFPLVRNIDISEGLSEATWPAWSKKLKALGCVAIDPDHRILTKELVDLAHKDGFRVMTYLLNDSGGLIPSNGKKRIDEVERIKRLNKWGVDTIITDLIHRVVPG